MEVCYWILSHNHSYTISLFSCSRNQETISNDRRQIITVDHHPACAKTTVPFLQIYKMIQKTSCACIRIRYTISHWMIDHTASEEEKSWLLHSNAHAKAACHSRFRGHQMASSIRYDLIREMYESINVGLVSTKNKKNRAPRIGLDYKNLC